MSALSYFTLDIVLPETQLELLKHIESDGVEEYAIDEAEVDRLLGEKAFSGGDVDAATIALIESQLENGRYRLYFHGEQAKERAQRAMELLTKENIAATLNEHDQQDWNEKWRQGYTTVEISPHLWIVPSWERETKAIPSDVTPLYLYPGQGFGTGRHETTALCLELFEKHAPTTLKQVLDFGCGSGILGIAAQLRGCDNVDYVDIDASALENTRQNLSENALKIKEEHLLLRTQYRAQNKYQLVFANILLDVLISEKATLLASLAPQAQLIVSGLLNEHVSAFRGAYADLQEIAHVSKGDWSALILATP